MNRVTVQQLTAATDRLWQLLQTRIAASSPHPTWLAWWSWYQEQTGIRQGREFTKAVAQAITCGQHAMWVAYRSGLPPQAVDWLVQQADPLVAEVLSLCSPTGQHHGCDAEVSIISNEIQQLVLAQPSPIHDTPEIEPTAPDRSSIYFFEEFLSAHDRSARRRKGVFYTPREIASYIVRGVDELLQDEFFLRDGLADNTTWRGLNGKRSGMSRATERSDDEPFVRILDPAMGSGVFLLEMIEQLHAKFLARNTQTNQSEAAGRSAWNEFVTDNLLPRLWGRELMLPALVLAQIEIASRLAHTGFLFLRPGKLHTYLSNSLRAPAKTDFENAAMSLAFTVVIGNPPFSGISANQGRWIRQLLRGREPSATGGVANYFVVDERPLRERKHWLEDDYVKFIRFAHWQVERAGAGIVALVTNHAFLDNLTFRGMRQQLMCTFPHVSLVDLHGNKRSGATENRPSDDDNLFDIEQGIAVSFFRRPPLAIDNQQIDHAQLRGPRADKLENLARRSTRSNDGVPICPCTPNYFFAPTDLSHQTEYEQGFRLPDIMPTNSTAAVTARDGFVVSLGIAELRDRLRQFRDLRISDATIRARFFTNTRSAKYLPGDTRGWRLTEARRQMSRQADWEKSIRLCLYRPFDRRYIFWTSWMIDWPRTNVMQHMLRGDNLALVTRRQIPATHPCDYFWVTDTITLDGLIRSDNRGSESVFPLFVNATSECPEQIPAAREPQEHETAVANRPNFSATFVQLCEDRLRMPWVAVRDCHQRDRMTAEDVFGFIYAQFHAPCYRQRFAAWLRVDFPRVFVPHQADFFWTLSALGQRLIQLHLLPETGSYNHTTDSPEEPTQLAAGYPRYADQKIWLNQDRAVGPVSRDVWEFRVGAHQVSRKWLKDRRDHPITRAALSQFRQIVTAIGDTIQLVRRISYAIEQRGGWETSLQRSPLARDDTDKS